MITKQDFIQTSVSFAILNDWFVQVSKDAKKFTEKRVLNEIENHKLFIHDESNKVIRLSDGNGNAIQLIL
jgi:hypothetical protein